MFKYKVSIYLKSGNIMPVRLSAYEIKVLRQLKLEHNADTFFDDSTYVELEEIEGIVAKAWWQRWG